MKFLISLFALLLITESCKSSKETIKTNTIKTSSKVQNTLSGSYTIIQVGNNEAVSEKLTITFDEKSNKVTGFAGCNTFYGTYTLQNNGIKFSNISSSKKYCQKDIMNVENDLLKVLKTVNTYIIKDKILSFASNNTVLLKGTKTRSIKKGDIVKTNYKTAVKYQASSRGSFEYVYISKYGISTSTDRGLKITNNYMCKEKDWEELNRLIEAVNMETFQKLEAPTDKRLHDGAAHATLAIQLGDVEHITPSFDHGHPPKEIEALVNKVLSIKENTVKQ